MFRTQSNIYDEVFYAKIVSGFLQKSSMIDTWLGSKYSKKPSFLSSLVYKVM